MHGVPERRPGGVAAARHVAWLFMAMVAPLLLTACLRQPAPASGTLQGVVTLLDGAPAAGATLTLQPEPASGSAAQRTATADADGSFRLERVRVGVYWLTVQSGATQSAVVKGVQVLEDEETIVDVQLTEAGALAGLAMLGDRPQAGGVLVGIPGTPLVVTSGVDGSYELSGVPSGTHAVSFSASGYAPAAHDGIVVVGGQTTPLPDVTLKRVAPYASFSLFVNGNVVQLDASASYDPNGRIVRYAWDLGDGTRVQGGPEMATLRHTYANSGDRTIVLTVLNDQGHTDSTSLTVNIALPQLRVGQGPYRVTLPGGTNGHWDVLVPAGTRGDVVYFEVEGAESIQVRRGSQIYYSAQGGTFRRLAGGAVTSQGLGHEPDAPGLDPQAIGVGRVCLGPCVMLPRSGGGATLTVHNPGTEARLVHIHLVSEPFNDLNEPNDHPGNATALPPGTDSGAIELVEDVDWFRVTQDGRLTFHGPTALVLQATLHDASGTRLNTLQSGVPIRVLAGDLVQVRPALPVAGPSGVSVYSLTLD